MNNPKDTFDALMSIAEFRINVRNGRMQQEWRVSTGLWIGMGAGMISIRNIPIPILATALAILALGHGFLWIRWNYKRNERDAARAYLCLEKAEEAIGIKPAAPSPSRPLGWLQHPPALFQFITTLFLSLAWVLVVEYGSNMSQVKFIGN